MQEARDLIKNDLQQQLLHGDHDERDETLTRESVRLVEAVQVLLGHMLAVWQLPRHGSLLAFKPELTLKFRWHRKATGTWRKIATNGLSARHIAMHCRRSNSCSVTRRPVASEAPSSDCSLL